MGRKKKEPIKSTREMLLAALHEAGGEKWLAQLAKDDPKTFAQLFAKLVPQSSAVSSEVDTSRARTALKIQFVGSHIVDNSSQTDDDDL